MLSRSRARRAEYICGVVCMVGANIEPLSIGDPLTVPDFNPSASENALALANEISPEPGNDRRSLWFSVRAVEYIIVRVQEPKANNVARQSG